MSSRRQTAVLVVASAVALLTVLDLSVVTVALPAMQRELGLSAGQLQWVVNAYALTLAGFLLLGGRAADLWGAELVFQVGLVVFTVSSLAGGLAVEGWQLITARAVQGVGGAVLAPVTLTLLTRTFRGSQERARALGIWAAVAGIGGALGGVLGGLLTGLLNWRWVLMINVPVGVALMVAALVVFPVRRGHGSHGRLDVPGAVAVTGASGALIGGITTAEGLGWSDPRTVALIAVAVVLALGFVAIERRVSAPLMPLSIFRIRSLVIANTLSLLTGGVVGATFFFLSLHLQNVHHATPVATGFLLLPGAIGISLGARLAPKLLRWASQRKAYLIGVALTVTGLLWLCTVVLLQSAPAQVLAPSFLAMAGCGFSGLPLTLSALADVPEDRVGLASGLLNTSRQLGGAVLLALLMAVAAAIAAPQRAGDLTAGYTAALVVMAFLVAATAPLGVRLSSARPKA
ncbi:MFS transporter [Nocardioides insulae]|uniref:MFS transporter n=1 Tax=Nocardioides insulae TaxID=394734 RepID=UPI001B7F9B84|nr:MFS transporter [Nocardioides insulae]